MNNMKAALIFVCLVFLLIAYIATEAHSRTIRMGIPGYNTTQIAFFAARDNGYYRGEGLDVDLIQMTGTVSNLALMNGQVDFTSVPTAAMTANLRGANLRVLFATFERPLFWLYSNNQIRRRQQAVPANGHGKLLETAGILKDRHLR
jgi:ABC-type nitrate/sulfonate/bicarbonate transport system substrate-binding protein